MKPESNVKTDIYSGVLKMESLHQKVIDMYCNENSTIPGIADYFGISEKQVVEIIKDYL